MKNCPLCHQNVAADLPQSPYQKFLARYCEVFKERYGSNPIIQGIDASTAKRIVNAAGFLKAVGLIETYLQMNDAFFVQRRHALKVFESSLNQVSIMHDTGKTITQDEARGMERRQTNLNAFGKLLSDKDQD